MQENLPEAFSVTSEEPHDHECFKCGGIWSHTDDECQQLTAYYGRNYEPAGCPECDERDK